MVRERRKPVVKEITVKLSDEKIVSMAHKIGALSTEKVLVQAEFVQSKAAYKGRIEGFQKEINTMVEAINAGAVKEEIEVVEVFDFDSGQVEVEHDGRVIDVRNMTGDERQMGLRLTPPDQEELLFTGSLASVTPISPVHGREPEPFRTELPAPDDCPAGEVFVTGDNERATVVKYGAISWRQEVAESAMYKVIEHDVFGTVTKVWEKAQALGVAEEQKQTTEEAAQ